MFLLYGTPLSSPSNKVRFLLNLLKTPYEFKQINIAKNEQKSSDYLKINAYGKIPAIDDNGFKLAESNAILRYLANKNNSNLYPKNLEERAIVDQWMDFSAAHIGLATSKLFFNMYIYKFREGATKDERSLQEGRLWLDRYLPVLEQQLTKQQYIAGNQLTLADLALLAALDVAEVVKVELTPYPHLNAWRKKLMNESFYQDCHRSFQDAFDKIMSARS